MSLLWVSPRGEENNKITTSTKRALTTAVARLFMKQGNIFPDKYCEAYDDQPWITTTLTEVAKSDSTDPEAKQRSSDKRSGRLKIITHNKIARAKIPLPTPMMRVIFEEGWGPLRRLVRRSVGIRPLKTSFRYASIIYNPSSCSINIILLIFLILSSYLLHAVLTILYIYMFPYILLYIINIYI